MLAEPHWQIYKIKNTGNTEEFEALKELFHYHYYKIFLKQYFSTNDSFYCLTVTSNFLNYVLDE